MSLVPCYRGSVNAWECDENDHLNVRFYLAKANQGLPFVLDAIGLPAAALLKMDAHPRIRAQHVRFLKEARPAVPLTVYAGLVAHQDHQLTLYAAAAAWLGGTEMFAPGIVSQVLVINAVTLVGLFALRQVVAGAALLIRRRRAHASPARLA